MMPRGPTVIERPADFGTTLRAVAFASVWLVVAVLRGFELLPLILGIMLVAMLVVNVLASWPFRVQIGPSGWAIRGGFWRTTWFEDGTVGYVDRTTVSYPLGPKMSVAIVRDSSGKPLYLIRLYGLPDEMTAALLAQRPPWPARRDSVTAWSLRRENPKAVSWTALVQAPLVLSCIGTLAIGATVAVLVHN
jgi:hypothetical protein